MLNSPSTITVLETVLYGFLFLHLLQWVTQKTEEPQAAETTIPFIGPIIQMIRCKSQFHIRTRRKYGLPAHTLRLPGIRIYVLNQLSLITAAQKQHNVLSFGPVMAQALGRISDTSTDANKAMTKDVLTDDGFLLGFNKAIYHTMAPGPSLETLTMRAAATFVTRTDELITNTSTTDTVSLFSWVRSTILRGTTDAVYGNQNPFRDPAVEKAWYNFEPGVTRLALRFMPSLATGKTRHARQVLVEAFTKYFGAGCPQESSDFMKARYDHIMRHGIRNIQDVSKLEVAGAFSIITNSAPTAFWFIYHIFSDPTALEICRKELSHLVHEQHNVCYLDIKAIKSACPVFHSTFLEVLRYYGVAQSIRMVLDDHKLDGTYLLRKGSLVMMPATVQHFDASIWGPNVNQFDCTRFTKIVPGDSGYKSDSKSSARGYHRGFGGGLHLCPGRHFATNEILTFAALLILRFNIIPANGMNWPEMDSGLSSKGSAVIMPNVGLNVVFVLRDKRKWAIVR